ncbi:MAG: PAS domain S-box protein, partial [Candidatus Hodarchaeota archaeon]
MPRILLVDDDEEFLGITKDFLAEEDPIFEVITSNSAQDALAKLAEDHFDIVVSDYQMPRMDGLALLERLRQNQNFIPFIIFTGQGREEVAIRALNLGADYYLRKGGDPQSQYAELSHVMRNVLSHKYVMQALQQTEERYRTLVRNIPIGLYRTTPGPKGRFLMANPALVRMLGYESEEDLKQIDVDTVYLNPSEREQYSDRLLSQRSFVGEEVRLKKKDGTPIWVSITAKIILREDGEIDFFDGLLEDITERKQTEEALRKSEAEKSIILSSTLDNVSYQNTDLEIIWANKAAADSVNMNADDLVGHHCYEIWHQRTDTCPNCPVAQAIRTCQVEQGEKTTPDGRIWDIHAYPVREEDAKISGVVEVTREITEQKRAEAALRESEERYRLIAENISDGLAIIQEGEVTYLNDRICEIFGYPREELRKLSSLDLVAPEDKERLQSIMDEFKRTKSSPKELEFWIARKDGTRRCIHNRYSYDAKGNRFIVTTDVTDRKQAEEALRESEERYRSIVENSLEGILIVAEDYRFTYVNDEMCRLLGYPREEIVGEDFRNFLDEESKTLVTERYIGRQRGEDVPSRYEFNIVRKNGEKRRVQISSTVITTSSGVKNTIALLLDITEQKEAEKALQVSEEKYRTILETIEDGYYEVDLAGNFTFFNESLRAILGYSAEELIGMNNREYMDSETAETLYKIFNAVYRTGKSTKIVDWENIRKNGSKAVMEGSVSLIKNSEGKGIGFRGIVRDVTERKHTEGALQESEQRYRTLVEN